MRVRRATLHDLTPIIMFCDDHKHVLKDGDPCFNPGFFRRQLRQAVKANDTEVFLAFTRNNDLCGVLIGWLAPYLWSHELYATDVLFLADQGGDRLLKAFAKWARSKNVTRLVTQTHLNYEGERVARFFERKGYRRVGEVFEK